MRLTAPALVLALSVLLPTSAAAADGERLQYHIPPGWIDVLDPAADTSKVPEQVIEQAHSGKFVVFAVDPASFSPDGANASLNVLEDDGERVLTDSILHRIVLKEAANVQGTGLTMDVIDQKITKLGNANIGVVNAMLSGPGGSMRMVQYLIPGKTKNAAMTFTCMPAAFDRYKPIFESSAMATTGAYAHFDPAKALRYGAITCGAGALLLVVLTVLAVVIYLRRKKSAAAAPPARAASSTWECPTCKRRVPRAVTQCRCGYALPPA